MKTENSCNMRPLPLNLQTLYADLLQRADPSGVKPGAISKKKVRGHEYLYLDVKEGKGRRQTSLGRADNLDVQAKAALHQRAAQAAKDSRTTVTALKNARIPAPSLPIGRVLEAVANAGLFQHGVVLVGTAAYQTYACIAGAYLASSSVMTADADLLVASFVGGQEPLDLQAILKKADPTFAAKMNQDDTLPKLFEAKGGLQVDVLTKFGRGRSTPVLVKGLGVSATALPFMEYLAEESMEAIALYGAGVLVRVPPPLRYAAHKLLIAQERNDRSKIKKAKDLAQAKELVSVSLEDNSGDWEETLANVRKRGPKWRKNIDASLREIGLDQRQGRFKV